MPAPPDPGRRPPRTAKGIYLPSEVIDSPAFRDLNGTQIKILLEFLLRRHIKGKAGPHWSLASRVTNNGDITFTYDEAERMGYNRVSFSAALDKLTDNGFIDVVQSSKGLHRAKSYYAISDRWRPWGTGLFVEKPRPKRKEPNRHGFQLGHEYFPPGRNGQEDSDTHGTL